MATPYRLRFVRASLLTTSSLLAACAAAPSGPKKPVLAVVEPVLESPDPEPDPFPGEIVIKNAVVLTAAGERFAPGYLRFKAGRITALGAGEPSDVPGSAEIIDAQGGTVTPGIIDTHTHMGVYPMPSADAHDDGNEAVRATTPEVWAEHAFWPQDPSLRRAIESGVTTVQVLPGSANLIGGRSFIAKLRPRTSARAMRFPGAHQGLKMACGENPKRVYGEKGGPQTRMGNVAGYRAAFVQARQYRRTWEEYARDLAHWRAMEGKDDDGEPTDPPTPPDRDLAMETLSKVLAGEIWVQNHCYRADEMHQMLDLAKAFGFTIRSFHHGLEAYKLADRLAKENVAVSTWADWWGFKMEAYDGIPYAPGLLSAAGVKLVIHSDDPVEIRRLNQHAAMAWGAAREIGLELSEDEVLRWFTYNPAWALGVEGQTGSLAVGKMADVVLWDGSPFSVYSRPTRVFIDGHTVFDRAHGAQTSDFEVGQFPEAITP